MIKFNIKHILLLLLVLFLIYITYDNCNCKIERFNISITKSYYSLFKNKIANIFSIIACCYFLFFITVPHCCKGQTIFGGFSENINLVYNIIFNNSKHINNTFKGI